MRGRSRGGGGGREGGRGAAAVGLVSEVVLGLDHGIWREGGREGGRGGEGKGKCVPMERLSLGATQGGREGGGGGRTQLFGQLVRQVSHFGESGARVPNGSESVGDALLASGYYGLDLRLGQVHVLLHDLVQVLLAGLREGRREGGRGMVGGSEKVFGRSV